MVADTAYGSAENLAWLLRRRGLIPFISVFDKSGRTDGPWFRSEFQWDEENERYVCPEGREFVQFRRNYSDLNSGKVNLGRHRYRARKSDCQVCPSRTRTQGYSPARKFETLARECVASDVYKMVTRNRWKKVEMLLAQLKRILGLTTLRLRGPCGAKDEFTTAATAQTSESSRSSGPRSPEQGIVT